MDIESFFLLVGSIFLLGALKVLLSGAIFFVTEDKALAIMIALAEIKPGQKAADIGSGNGKVVIALARAGAEAHGYENNPLLVWSSRKKIRQAGLDGEAFIHHKNFWKEDFTKFQIVTVYGIPHIMKRLEDKLQQELPPTARVILNSFPFPTWRKETEVGQVFLYKNYRS